MPGRHSIALFGCATLALLLSSGCSSDFPVYPVRGKVMFEGKPMVGGGSISLVPLASMEGKTAGGEIAPDGTYTLSTYTDGDGSIVGEFRVVINQIVVVEPKGTSSEEETLAAPTSAVPEADRIPAIYSDPQNSPLRAKVEAKSPNEIDFQLLRKP